MNIGILVLSIGNFGKKGFYNIQEIGHARALSKLCSSVQVYRLVDISQEKQVESIEGCPNARICFLPSKQLGSNGFPDLSQLDPNLDVLVLCADTQLAVPQVSRWAKRNRIRLIPYIGVTKSHSTSSIKRKIMDLLFQRNLAVYKKHHCAVKTPTVKAELENLGVSSVTVAPVGLDLSLMRQGVHEANAITLKEKFGYQAEDKVLLFVGRLIEEKQPIRMIDIFSRLSKTDGRYKLLMVGSGEKKEAVVSAIREYGIEDKVQMIERIPNAEIWELYRLADCFVNLNQQEIFGMAILEAMYYGCKVVAWKAPGPSFIIEDGVSGCLADSDEEIENAILNRSIISEAAHTRIVNGFTWECTARQILRIASNNEGDT